MITNKANASIKYTLPDSSIEEKDFDSNTVESYKMNDLITAVKSSNKTFLKSEEVALQKVVITNASTTTMINPYFYDVLSGSGNYVAGSVVVNGEKQPDYDLVEGFSISDIAAGGSATIEYQVKAKENDAEKIITNYGKINYSIQDETQGKVDFNLDSNIVEIQYVNVRLTAVKEVDKKYVKSGDVINYTILISNVGNTPTTELIFTDLIPEGTTFVEDSLTMDNLPMKGKNPADGVKIANIAGGQKTTMRFQVTVD